MMLINDSSRAVARGELCYVLAADFSAQTSVAFVPMFSFLWLIPRLRDQPFVDCCLFAVCSLIDPFRTRNNQCL
jgi:hypothetical protein